MTSKIKSWVAIGLLAQAGASMAQAASEQTPVTNTPPPTAPVQKAPIQSQSVNANPSNNYTPPGSDADWKTPGLPPLYNFGGMTGLGVIDSYGGFTILGTASLTVLDRGFIPDISNSVATEIEAGPMITSGHGAFWYSLHMRWDFQKDNSWTFYAIAGLAGNGTPSSLGGHFEIWPRFGAGAIYKITSFVSLRGEVSHEFTGIGISVPFM